MVDYQYLGKSMANLSGVPVRIFEGETELCKFFPARLPKDPIELYRDGVFAIMNGSRLL